MLAVFRFFAITLQQTNHQNFDDMKRLIFYICFLNIAICSLATGQDSEVIYIDGEKWQLLGRPINRDTALVYAIKNSTNNYKKSWYFLCRRYSK